MPLDNPNTVVIPAVEEKTFPHLWLSNIVVHAPSATSGRIRVETIPYNADTQEIGSGQDMVALDTSDLWTAVQEVPEVAAAMQAIFDSIEPLRAWIEAKKQETEQPSE